MLNVLILPKTIDNDVVKTGVTFGFNAAMEIATEAIDRLHSTTHSHHRIIVVEVMGHNTGWLALDAGIASGDDVILIPEIPYDTEEITKAIRKRQLRGNNFSIVVAEGVCQKNTVKNIVNLKQKNRRQKKTRMKKLRKNHS